jgi:hypothetical protein
VLDTNPSMPLPIIPNSLQRPPRRYTSLNESIKVQIGYKQLHRAADASRQRTRWCKVEARSARIEVKSIKLRTDKYRRSPTVGNSTKKQTKVKCHDRAVAHQRRYNAMPGMGFRTGICKGALGFMGLGPGGGPRRAVWLAEFERGRPICGAAPWGPGDMERGWLA